MLVLSRKRGEKIVVCCGDQVTVLEVLEMGGGRVRLGISAPPEVMIHRGELCNRGPERSVPNRKLIDTV